jgi:hypothetical protein
MLRVTVVGMGVGVRVAVIVLVIMLVIMGVAVIVAMLVGVIVGVGLVGTAWPALMIMIMMVISLCHHLHRSCTKQCDANRNFSLAMYQHLSQHMSGTI